MKVVTAAILATLTLAPAAAVAQVAVPTSPTISGIINDRDALRTALANANNQITGLKAQAVTNVATIASLNATITQLRARIAELEAGSPPPPPPPVESPADARQISASNTGVPAGACTTVTIRTDRVVTSSAGQLFNCFDMRAGMAINHDGVIVSNSKLAGGDFFIIQTGDSRSGLIFRNNDIVGTGQGGACITASGFTATGNDISGCENLFNVVGSNFVISGNYLHDMKGPSTAHFDNIQIDGGNSDGLIEGNWIENFHNNTSTVMIDNCFGPITNIKVRRNVLKDGGSMTVYADNRFTSAQSPCRGGAMTGVEYTDNWMTPSNSWNAYGIVPGVSVWSGNVNLDSGASIPRP